jgi:hypothetical protein
MKVDRVPDELRPHDYVDLRMARKPYVPLDRALRAFLESQSAAAQR